MDWLDVRLTSQGESWRCTVTTLEYLTGIPRDDIIREMGHDGGIRLKSIRDKLKNEESVSETEDSIRVGVVESETLWWLYKNNINATHIKTKEFLDFELCEERRHDEIYCPSQEELWASIQGKCALLSKELYLDRNIWHHVAWFGNMAFEPAWGQITTIEPQNVFSAIILHNIVPEQRLLEIICTA